MAKMLRAIKFKGEHMEQLASGPISEPGTVSMADNPEARKALETMNSWTILRWDKTPLACVGAIEQWPGRYLLWAILSHECGPHMLAITRICRHLLTTVGPGRVELDVREDFPAGHKWARLLGFYMETPVKLCYGTDRSTYTGYVRIQD